MMNGSRDARGKRLASANPSRLWAVLFLASRSTVWNSSFLRWRTLWRADPGISACVGGALPRHHSGTGNAIAGVTVQARSSGSNALENARVSRPAHCRCVSTRMQMCGAIWRDERGQWHGSDRLACARRA